MDSLPFMKNYDVIAIGTGSAMNIVSTLVETQPNIKVAVVEKDDVGGICLTRGCIPSKMLLYPAELLRKIMDAKKFGIDVEIKGIDFKGIMERMRKNIRHEIEMIEHGLKNSPNIDLYQVQGEFIDDYTMKVGNEIIKGDKILLCSGSRPMVPPIKGLKEAGYITSDELLLLEELPPRIVIIGGGYIAMEYGFFLAMMGSDVTVIEMLPRIVANEEPEISELLQREMEKIMKIYKQMSMAGLSSMNICRQQSRIYGHVAMQQESICSSTPPTMKARLFTIMHLLIAVLKPIIMQFHMQYSLIQR